MAYRKRALVSTSLTNRILSPATRGSESSSTQLGLSAELRHALPPFNALCAFEAVATHGGIRRAAAALPRDHAAVSRHLRTLELWAGVPLIDRGDGKLTPAGWRFYARISAAMKEIASASIELTHRGDERSLRLWCVPGIASRWLAPRLVSFASAYPNIDLELQPTEATPNFSSHEADALLRYIPDIRVNGVIPDPTLRSVEIARPRVLAVASPRLVAKMKPITGPADLLQAPLLHESNFDQWRRWFAAHSIEAGDAITGPRLWHGDLTVVAAERGQGVALTNVLLVGSELRRGVLVEVACGDPVHLGSYVFTARRDRWHDRAILCFRRWLEQSIAWAVPAPNMA